MRAVLVPAEGGDPIELTKDLTLVGRKEDCDLRLDHKSVSKMHCVLVKTEGMLFVRDLGSTNSTRVNGKRVRRSTLFPNDQLTIANFKFTVQLGGEEAPIRPDEYTQQLDAKEVVALLNRSKAVEAAADDDSDEIGGQRVQPNPLPDVYPEDEPRSKGK